VALGGAEATKSFGLHQIAPVASPVLKVTVGSGDVKKRPESPAAGRTKME
jgi:hypothetical protein